VSSFIQRLDQAAWSVSEWILHGYSFSPFALFLASMKDPGMPPIHASDTIAVTGATGYVGGRLVPALLDAGYRVRCLVREPRKLDARPWRHHANVEVIGVDIAETVAVTAALRGCRAAYYLVHSMGGPANFAAADRVHRQPDEVTSN
jgi:nucleoside-diphosphate-sugar epimerase